MDGQELMDTLFTDTQMDGQELMDKPFADRQMDGQASMGQTHMFYTYR